MVDKTTTTRRGRIMAKISLTKLAITITTISIIAAIPGVYLHEYIHYRQADCHIENQGKTFTQRMKWTLEPPLNNEEPSAIAVINLSGCPSPNKVNEKEPVFYQTIFQLTLTITAIYLIIKHKKNWVTKQK